MTTVDTTNEEFPPLDIKCTSSDCDSGLHCFRQKRKLAREQMGGRCRTCGADLVDWSRVYKRDPADVTYTFAALKYEMIRHHYWHVTIDQDATNHARRKGLLGLRDAAERRVRKSVGPAQPSFDGRQTPKGGNILYYGQHATASCCRKCIAEWHGIPMGRPLTDAEVSYLTELLLLYVKERMPALSENGEKIPRRRREMQYMTISTS